MLSLSNLKNHLIRKNEVSLMELIAEYQEPAKNIQCMMSHFIKKGRVTECKLTPKCGTTCQQCKIPVTIVYKWKG